MEGRLTIASNSYRFENLGRRGLADYSLAFPLPKKPWATPPKLGVSRANHSPNKPPLKHGRIRKMAQKRPRAAPDSARFRDGLMSICQGYAQGQMLTVTIVLEDICTTKGQQRGLFGALPAGHLREKFFRGKHRKKTSEAGRAPSFLISRQVRPRYASRPCPPPPADTCSANRSTLSTVWFTAPPQPESITCSVPGEAAAQRVGKRQELAWRNG